VTRRLASDDERDVRTTFDDRQLRANWIALDSSGSIYRIVRLTLRFDRHVVYNVRSMRALLLSYLVGLGDHLAQDTRLFGIT